MMIEAQQRKVALYAQDVARIEPQTLQGICLEVGGRKIAGPDAVGEALRGLIKATRDELRAGGREIEQIVGRFGGFDLGVQATRGEEVPSLYLSGACVYEATTYQTGPALVAALVDLLASIPRQRASGENQLDVRRKRLDDIRLELDRPFEHESRLLDLLTRQRELLKRLDLDKDEAGTMKVDVDEERQAA